MHFSKNLKKNGTYVTQTLTSLFLFSPVGKP